MSEAPAAPVTENGVPPATQETLEEPTGFKVFAGNLAYNTTDDGLRAFFTPVQSDILTAQVILRGTRPLGYGFVSLSSADAALKAVELLNKQELDGRQVIVEIAKPADQKDKDRKPRTKRSGRRGSKAVPGEVSEAEANAQADKPEAPAAPATEEVAKPKKKKKSTRKPKRKPAPANGEAAPAEGAAPVPPTETPPTEAAAPKKRGPRRVNHPRRPAGEDPIGEPSKTVLFVANLGFSIDDAGLSALFTDQGITVHSARVVLSRFPKFRRSKGYGFVDVGSEEEQKKAVELLLGKEVDGRPIVVKIAVDSPRAEEASPEDAPAATAA